MATLVIVTTERVEIEPENVAHALADSMNRLQNIYLGDRSPEDLASSNKYAIKYDVTVEQ